MRTSRAGEAAFVGRAKVLADMRAAIASGLPVWITGEAGIGKTALAKRAAPEALYIPVCTPTKEVLVSLLLELHQRGFYAPKSDDDDEPSDEISLRKSFKKIDNRQAVIEICAGFRALALDSGGAPVVILDDFDTATATTIRLVKQLGAGATLVCCTTEAKAAQKAFLFNCSKFAVSRLTNRETELLAGKLLDDYAGDISERERPRLVRQIVEQSQGAPAIARELVKRIAARGDLSLSAVRRENLHGSTPLDMTPALIVVGIVFVGWRVAMRPLHDADMSVLFGFSGAGLMLLRLLAFRMARRSPRR